MRTDQQLWAGIVRVSHVGGRGGGSFHADTEQVQSVERYAARHGARVEFMAPELSVSGGLPIDARPPLRAAIEGVEAGIYSGVVVAYLSRLTRSRSGLEIWERVEAAGGTVHCAQEDLDTSTPNGRFIRDIHLANAVREREEHVARFDDRRRQATAAGVWQRRQTPRGYRRDDVTRRLVPDDSAGIVRQAFADRAAGLPVVDIADALSMTTSGVRALLRNRVYLGELRVGGYVNLAAHQPIVGAELFDEVQTARHPRPARRHQHVALLAGLVRCQACGHAMTRSRSGGYPTYLCPGRHSGGRCPAPGGVMCHLLDDYVSGIARAALGRVTVTSSERGAARDRLRADVAAAQAELAAYVEAVSAADVGADVFAAGARLRRGRADEAREALRAADAAATVPPGLANAAAVWDDLPVEDRRRVLGGLLDVVVVRRAGRQRVPLEDRVRVIRHASGLAIPAKQGDAPMGVCPIDWLDAGDERVLRVPFGK